VEEGTAMSEEDAIALITGLICKARGIDRSHVSETTDLACGLGFDSLDAAELLAGIHQETGLAIDATSVNDMQTVRDIARRLTQSGHAQEVSLR
jgi:acyl carrier protein